MHVCTHAGIATSTERKHAGRARIIVQTKLNENIQLVHRYQSYLPSEEKVIGFKQENGRALALREKKCDGVLARVNCERCFVDSK